MLALQTERRLQFRRALWRWPLALLVIVGVAASAPAASNYRPLRGDAYPAYRAEPRDAGDSMDSFDQEFHRLPVRELRRERPSSFGSDRDRFDLPYRPEFDRADFNRRSSTPGIRENRSDSFRLVAPRWRDAAEARGRPAEPDQPAAGVPLLDALPACGSALQGRGTGAARKIGRAHV